MTEHRVVKRTLLLFAAALGCLCSFWGLVVSAGAALQRREEPMIVLSEEPAEIKLPCRVGGTELIARQLVMYEGPNLEKGTDEPVSDITALILYNGGDREIAQAEVILAGEEELIFFASNIMPGAQVLVLEKNAAAWKERQITACSGWINELADPSLPEQALYIEELDMGTLAVTNMTRSPLGQIWLFYKNYLPDAQLYVGGITYITVIDTLEPGQTVQISPYHYAAGYSRILKAQTVP